MGTQSINKVMKMFKTIPDLQKQLETLNAIDLEALENAAIAMEKAGLNADAIWEKIVDTEEEERDIALAMQEIKDSNF